MMKTGSVERQRQLTGRHVLIGIVGFFAVVFAVNGFIVAEALSTRTGTVADEPYIKGLKYNERIAADERQTGLGWQLIADVAKDRRTVTVSLNDRTGSPLAQLAASMTIGRPATTAADLNLALAERSPGRYVAELPAGEAGAFIADIEVRRAGSDDIIFRARRRLWIAP